jgi:hypothetical protein
MRQWIPKLLERKKKLFAPSGDLKGRHLLAAAARPFSADGLCPAVRFAAGIA